MMSLKKLLLIIMTLLLPVWISHASADDSASPTCKNAKIFEKIFKQICWDCFMPMNIMGVGDKPDGASDAFGGCYCLDGLGVPEFGWPLAGFQPARLNEVVTQPWCSPSLGGITMQKSNGEYGSTVKNDNKEGTQQKGFYNYHYFAYPIFKILEIFLVPGCDPDPYVDLDMLYMSELDPMWSDDMLSFLLTREAVIFSNPIAYTMCMADGAYITATGKAIESMYFCAGTDGKFVSTYRKI